MQNESSNFLSQIEINTISVGAGNSADSVNKFFRYFYKKHPEIYNGIDSSNVPCENEYIIDNITSALYTAVSLAFPGNYKEKLIIFVVLEVEANLFDQYAIQNELYNK